MTNQNQNAKLTPKLNERERRIVRRAEVVGAGTLEHQLTETRYYESGQEAFSRDFLVQDCPYRAGPEQDDWIRGFLSAHRTAAESR